MSSRRARARPAAARLAALAIRGLVGVIGIVGASPAAYAHPLNPALLDLRERGDGSCDVRWRVPLGGPALAPLAVELPPSWRTREPPVSELVRAGQSVATRWRVDCAPAGLAGARLAVAGLDARRSDALVRLSRADGTTLQTVLRPGHGDFVVPARRSVASIAGAYLTLGVRHILSGADHLLFVLGLVLLVADPRRLWWTVTAFTVGHSVTLSLAALGVVRIPPRPVEILIALSIVVVAVELVRAPARRRLGARPWLMASAFGLLHGLGFAGALAEVGLPPRDIPLALAAFNAGIELGQLAFILVVLVVAGLARPRLPAALGRLHLAPAYAIGAIAVYFVLDRAL